MEYFMLLPFFATFLVIYGIFYVVMQLLRKRHFYKLASKFGGPLALPLIGSAHLFIGDGEAVMNTITELPKKYSAPCRVWIGNSLLICVTTPEEFKEVCNSHKTLDKSDFYKFVKPWLGTGIVLATGDKWRIHHALLQPSFRRSKLRNHIKIFSAQSIKTVEKMEEHLDGPEFAVVDFATSFALNAICETSMGVKLETPEYEKCEFAKAIRELMDIICKRAFSPWLHPDFIFCRTKLGKDHQKYIEYLNDFTDNVTVIQTRKKELIKTSCQSNSTKSEGDGCNMESPNKSLMDDLLELSRENGIMSDREIRDELHAMVVAGTDTTAIVLCSAMLMLASHPEVQDKAYQELHEIYGDVDGDDLLVTPEDLTRMKYLECVIKETMRLFPIMPGLLRAVTEDFQIGAHTYPRGSTIVLATIHVQRSPTYWSDPLKFDPDRFSPKATAERHSFAYLPFSGGMRSCVGFRYAMMSMKVFLAIIVRRYILKKNNIVPVKDIRLAMAMLLRPVNPIQVRIERRRRRRSN